MRLEGRGGAISFYEPAFRNDAYTVAEWPFE